MRNTPLPNEAASCAFEVFRAGMLPCVAASEISAQLKALGRLRIATSGGSIASDDTQDTLVFLASGAAKLVAFASQGREQVLSFHFAGDLISVPAPRAHAYALLALRASEAIVFPADELLSVAHEHPAMMGRIVCSAYTSLRRSREKSIVIGRKTARERVASFLVSMAERIGLPEGNRCVLPLPMSRRDIADSLGLTIETISRQLGDLRGDGLIETSGRSTIRLLDLAALAACAGHLINQSSQI